MAKIKTLLEVSGGRGDAQMFYVHRFLQRMLHRLRVHLHEVSE